MLFITSAHCVLRISKAEDIQEPLLRALASDDLAFSCPLVRPCDIVDAEARNHFCSDGVDDEDEDNASEADWQGNVLGSIIGNQGIDVVELDSCDQIEDCFCLFLIIIDV